MIKQTIKADQTKQIEQIIKFKQKHNTMKKQNENPNSCPRTRQVFVEVSPEFLATFPSSVKIPVSKGFLDREAPLLVSLGLIDGEKLSEAMSGIKTKESKTVRAEMAGQNDSESLKRSESGQPKRSESETRTSGMAPEREESESKTTFRLVEIAEDDDEINQVEDDADEYNQ